MSNQSTYTTPVSGVVLIKGIFREMVVRVFAGVPRVVDPAYHRPIKGYHPMLEHRTEHAVNAVRKTADEDGYANHRASLLIGKAARVQGNARGLKNYNKQQQWTLFDLVTHMTSFDPEHWTPERVQKLHEDLAAQF